jgi:hemerythrin
MSLVWTKDCSVGHPQVDDQHRKLFDAANRLFDAMKAGQGREVVGPLISFLADYVDKHFKAEEALMASSGYQDTWRHQGEHQAFVETFQKLAAQYEREGAGPVLSIQLQRTVSDWLMDHILKSDRRLGLHLQQSKAA